MNKSKEPGFVAFPNELLEKLLTSTLASTEWRIVCFVMRYSEGCRRKKWVHLKFWSDLTHAGVYKGDIRERLEHLENEKILIVDWDKKMLRLNHNYDEWSLSMVMGSSPERHRKILNFNLQKVSPQLTNSEKTLVSDLPDSKSTTNTGVSPQLTAPASKSSDDAESEHPKQTLTNSLHTTTHTDGVVAEFGLSEKKMKKLIDEYGEEAVMKRVDIISRKNGDVSSKAGLLIHSLKEGYVPNLSAEAQRLTKKEREVRKELASLEEQLALGIQETDESKLRMPKKQFVEQLVWRINGLKQSLGE